MSPSSGTNTADRGDSPSHRVSAGVVGSLDVPACWLAPEYPEFRERTGGKERIVWGKIKRAVRFRTARRYWPDMPRQARRLALPQNCFCGSLPARPGLASIVKARKLQGPSGGGVEFEQRPHGLGLGPSRPPSASLRIGKVSSLACRFSWFCPNSGHPSSLVGFSRCRFYTIRLQHEARRCHRRKNGEGI